MSQCWCENPAHRPTFNAIRQQLDELLTHQRNYLDLDNLATTTAAAASTTVDAGEGPSFPPPGTILDPSSFLNLNRPDDEDDDLDDLTNLGCHPAGLLAPGCALLRSPPTPLSLTSPPVGLELRPMTSPTTITGSVSADGYQTVRRIQSPPAPAPAHPPAPSACVAGLAAASETDNNYLQASGIAAVVGAAGAVSGNDERPSCSSPSTSSSSTIVAVV